MNIAGSHGLISLISASQWTNAPSFLSFETSSLSLSLSVWFVIFSWIGISLSQSVSRQNSVENVSFHLWLWVLYYLYLFFFFLVWDKRKNQPVCRSSRKKKKKRGIFRPVNFFFHLFIGSFDFVSSIDLPASSLLEKKKKTDLLTLYTKK